MPLLITHPPPYLTVQDAGRTGYRAEGVPGAGVMDAWAMQAGNALVGNAPGAAVLEWGLGGGEVVFTEERGVALTGASVEAVLDGEPVPSCRACRARPGSVLRIVRFTAGRFLYLAVQGGLDVPVVLGSRSTYLPGRFGGYAGRRLAAGDVLSTGRPAGPAPPRGFEVPPGLRRVYARETIRVVRGPQAGDFAAEALGLLETASFRVSAASDRMGYRLEGPALRHAPGRAPLVSEAVCPGAVQVPENGAPIVLLADGPTVGGYPKIAVVITADLSLLVQKTPGETVRFRFVSVADAQKALRRAAAELFTLRHLGDEAANRY